jgi:hypothetical protein
MEVYVGNPMLLINTNTKISISELSHKTSQESEINKQKGLLQKIYEELVAEKAHSYSLPEERFGHIEKLLELYFDLGREVNKTGSSKLSDENNDLVRKTAYGIQDISSSIEEFLREFTSTYLDFGEEGSGKYVCILRSGLEYMFGLYDTMLELVYEDGTSCTYGEVVKSIQEEGSFSILIEDFQHWWKTECYLDKKAKNMGPRDHWWWE